VRVAEANLDNLQTGSREQEIAVIRAQLAQAQAEQSLADTNLKRSEQLFQRGNAAVAQVDTDRTKLAAAVAQVTQLEAQLKVAELPARDAQRIAAEASLDAAKAQAQSAHSALDDRVVLAPATGIVDKVYFENGEVAGGGAPVMSILPDDSLRARFFLPESRRAEFMIGDTFVVSCNGCAEGITAMMTRISPSPQFTPPIIYSREERSRLVFQTDARIAKGSHLLPGQPITVSPAK